MYAREHLNDVHGQKFSIQRRHVEPESYRSFRPHGIFPRTGNASHKLMMRSMSDAIYLVRLKHPVWNATQFDGQVPYTVRVEIEPEDDRETLFSGSVAYLLMESNKFSSVTKERLRSLQSYVIAVRPKPRVICRIHIASNFGHKGVLPMVCLLGNDGQDIRKSRRGARSIRGKIGTRNVLGHDTAALTVIENVLASVSWSYENGLSQSYRPTSLRTRCPPGAVDDIKITIFLDAIVWKREPEDSEKWLGIFVVGRKWDDTTSGCVYNFTRSAFSLIPFSACILAKDVSCQLVHLPKRKRGLLIPPIKSQLDPRYDTGDRERTAGNAWTDGWTGCSEAKPQTPYYTVSFEV
ncbi:hypothetical protein V8B97DRAFT_1917178 [Scleroderma yunnanense]